MKKKIEKCDFFGPCDEQDAFSNKFSDITDTYKLDGNKCFFCGEDLSSFIDSEDIIEETKPELNKYGVAINKKDSMN